MACKNCYNQLNGYETSGKNVKMLGDYSGRIPRSAYKPQKSKPKSTYNPPRYNPYYREALKYKQLTPTEPVLTTPTPVTEVNTIPMYYSLDINTTINPLMEEYNKLTNYLDKFNYWSNNPYDNSGKYIGWEKSALNNGISQEEVNLMKPYALKWAGSTETYKPEFKKNDPINSTITKYYDQNMNLILSVPQGAQVTQLPTIYNTYDSSKNITKNFKKGGTLNYFDYLK